MLKRFACAAFFTAIPLLGAGSARAQADAAVPETPAAQAGSTIRQAELTLPVTFDPAFTTSGPASTTTETLPDAPEPVLDSADPQAGGSQPALLPNGTPIQARRYAITIKAGQVAAPPTAALKFAIAFRKPVSAEGLVSPIFAAGYGQLRNNRPHYGTDEGAFGERIGAAYLRESVQAVLHYGIYSTVFHTDPRYYVRGPEHSFKYRFGYAASRVFVGRTDGGRQVPNVALIGAVFTSSAMTDLYYPAVDHDPARTIRSALSSLTFRAGATELREFNEEIVHILHLKKR